MRTLQHNRKPQGTLYQEVAGKLVTLIEGRTLQPGQRVPSVRKLSRQWKVSISTVLQSFRVLESRGLIEARPQSGHYVRFPRRPAPAEPEVTRPGTTATAVSLSNVVTQLIRVARRGDFVPLGTSIASDQFLPVRKLGMMLTRVTRDHPKQVHGYEFPPGCQSLREQIARRALEADCSLSPEDLIITNGAQEALSLCLRAVTMPGDTIAIESPTFYGILEIIESLHLKAIEVPMHPRDGMRLDALRRILSSNRIKAVVSITNFHNPLGCTMPDASKQELARLLAKKEIPLIEDDVYGELNFEGSRPRCAKSFDKKGLVLLCGSFSKTLSPGFRIGWTAPGRFRDAVERLKFAASAANVSATQLAIARFLETGGYDHHIRKLRRSLADTTARMTQSVCDHFPSGTRVTRPAGGFVLWVELPRKIDTMDLLQLALKERITLAPGPIFSPTRRYRNFIRLSCGHPHTNLIEDAMQILGRLIAI